MVPRKGTLISGANTPKNSAAEPARAIICELFFALLCVVGTAPSSAKTLPCDGASMLLSRGAPHPMHTAALLEISRPHSEQCTRAIYCSLSMKGCLRLLPTSLNRDQA